MGAGQCTTKVQSCHCENAQRCPTCEHGREEACFVIGGNERYSECYVGSSFDNSNCEPDTGQGQSVVKAFVGSLVKGHPVSLLLSSGKTVQRIVYLNADLTNLSLRRNRNGVGRQYTVKLQAICHVVIGVTDEDFGLPVDKRCVTLVLDGGQCLSFRLNNKEGRDLFGLCLAMFVDSRRPGLSPCRDLGQPDETGTVVDDKSTTAEPCNAIA